MSTSNEYQLQLVFQTFEKDFQLNIHKVARLYNIFHTILTHYINGRSIYADTIANSRKLTALEKEMVVREVFDLDLRRFFPRMYDVKDMVNRLLTTRDAIYIGSYWVFNFVK